MSARRQWYPSFGWCCAATGMPSPCLLYTSTVSPPILLTDRLCCEAREAGSFLSAIARTHAGQGKKLAFIAGGETVVHLTGKGLGGRNQELALAAAPALAGQNTAVFSCLLYTSRCV